MFNAEVSCDAPKRAVSKLIILAEADAYPQVNNIRITTERIVCMMMIVLFVYAT